MIAFEAPVRRCNERNQEHIDADNNVAQIHDVSLVEVKVLDTLVVLFTLDTVFQKTIEPFLCVKITHIVALRNLLIIDFISPRSFVLLIIDFSRRSVVFFID